MRTEPAREGGISLDFAGIPPTWYENFPKESARVGQSRKQGGIEFSMINLCFFFQMLIKGFTILPTHPHSVTPTHSHPHPVTLTHIYPYPVTPTHIDP